MCGLVGIYGRDLSEAAVSMFSKMLWLDTFRGPHSTGVAAVREIKRQKRDLLIMKSLGTPSDLWGSFPEVFHNMGDLIQTKEDNFHLLLGHNRFRTLGEISVVNAHPFQHGSIVGAHNGTINTGLEKLPSEGCKGQTDSEKVFNALSKGWNLQKIIDATNGAYALTYYDVENDVMNMFRNSQRDLHIFRPMGMNFVAWASEAWMIREAAAKSKIEVPHDSIKLLPANNHICFQWKNNRVEEVGVYTVEKKYQHVQNVSYQGRSSNYYEGDWTKNWGENSTSRLLLGKPEEGEKERSGKGWFRHEFLDLSTFEAAVTGGCCACNTKLVWTDRAKIKWFDAKHPICATCAEDFYEPNEGAV